MPDRHQLFQIVKDLWEEAPLEALVRQSDLEENSLVMQSYRGYEIAFGKPWKDSDGRERWSVTVWKPFGRAYIGIFKTAHDCVADVDEDFFYAELDWARAHIDDLLGQQ